MSLADDTMLDAPVCAIPILRSGVLAQATCRRGGLAEVAAVFARSFYLRAGDTFVCVGAPAIGNGPLTLIADIGGSIRLSDLGLRAGQPAEMSARHIAIGGGVRFDLGDSEAWCPPARPAALPPDRLIEARATLARCAAVEAPAEGLARVAFSAPNPIAHTTSFGRIARKRIASFESSLSAVIAGGQAPLSRESIRGLIGLGPGLTPSGDDFLSGALALFDALAMPQLHACLAQAVIDAAALTSPLSACLLRAAASGHIGEHLHRAVASLITGDIAAAVAAARRIGHSSGWDMLAGAATALRVVVHELPITDG